MFTKIEVLEPPDKKVIKSIKKFNLESTYNKRVKQLRENPQLHSLDVKKIQPKHRNIWQFRLTRKYRGRFIVTELNDAGEAEVEIIEVGDPH